MDNHSNNFKPCVIDISVPAEMLKTQEDYRKKEIEKAFKATLPPKIHYWVYDNIII